MPYIGNSPANNVRGRFYYTATAAQTVFSGADSNGKTLAYQDGGYVDVYLNGVLLQDTTDYTATTKTSVTLTSGATAGDLVEIVAYGIFSVADSVSALSGGTFEGAVVVNNNFTVDNGTIKLDGNYPVGSSNVAIGDTALDDASFSGANNVAVGHAAMSSTTSGNFNSGVGAYSLNSNTTGSSNSSYGSSSLENNTTGSSNSAYGAGALNSNTTASNNTAVGYQAGYNNTTGGNLVATGYQALYSNTTGNDNNAFGWQALYANTTGSNNTSLGFRSLYSNTTANSNTAVGYQALYATTGASNVSVGYASGDANTTGYENVFLGTAAGSANTTGIRNLYVGNNAGEIATTGSNNTYVGANGTAGSCGGVMTTGSRNTILGGYTGNQGGVDIRTSSNNIVLSYGDGNPRVYINGSGYIHSTPTYNNTTGAGANLVVESSGQFVRSTSSLRYKNTINDATHGLSELLTLRPVTYKGNNDGDTVFGGLIAEEVHDAGLTEFVQYNDDGEPDALAYGNMVSLCIKAIQEQQATITALEARITALENA